MFDIFAAHDRDELADILARYAAIHDARVAYIDRTGQSLSPVGTYPPEWITRYLARRYDRIDPILDRLDASPAPVSWSEINRGWTDSSATARIMGEASEHGLRFGVTVPLFGPRGCEGVFSLASLHSDVEEPGFIRQATLFAAQWGMAWRLASAPENGADMPVLTSREREVLHWIAAGKTSVDAAAILRISERTVNFHVGNAMRKLGATSRPAAVHRALRLGFICR